MIYGIHHYMYTPTIHTIILYAEYIHVQMNKLVVIQACPLVWYLASAWRKSPVLWMFAVLPRQHTTSPYSCRMCSISHVAATHIQQYTQVL